MSAPFEKLAADALKAIGKTLGQMNLYRVGHPSVAATLQETMGYLAEMLDQTGGEVAYSIDQDKLIANGRIVSSVSLAPHAVVGVFTRFRLNSLTFRSGVTEAELIALCELASMKAESAKDLAAAEYLTGRGVSHIAVNEAIYAKVEKKEAGPAPVETGAAAPPPDPSLTPEALSAQPFEDSVQTLVRKAVPDPADQERVYQAVMRRIREDIERRILEATQGLKRQKTALENEAARTSAVLGSVAEGVVVVDDAGKVLMMNPAAEALYGVRLADVAGKPLSAHAREEHLVALAKEMTVPEEGRVRGEVAVTAAEDSRRSLRAASAVVQDQAGKPVGMVSALTDVVKHKEVQRMEREFIAHVTHELRAPLSSIRAALEILQGQIGGNLGQEESRMFGTALKNTDRLEGLVSSILDFGKIESGQMTVHTRPVAPIEMVREGAEGLRPWCQKKGLALQVEAPDGLPAVLADAPRVVQVLVNLLSNAVKFTPSGGTISVRAAMGGGEEEGRVVFSVADSGPGIDPKDHQRVFEKFVQIASGERHVGGTGLGLAIAKSLVELHKGRMWIESELGRGATFRFTLPQYVAPLEAAPPPPPPPQRPWWRRLLGLK